MSILTGFKKVKNYILTSSGYQLLSRWTSSQTVEFDDGKTAQTKLGEINGIAKTYVDMKKATDNSMAVSAKAVMEGLENSSALISMTQAEYDALSDEEKTDNNMRAILDANPDVVDAKNVNFDNTNTNLTATNTQSAITELNGKLEWKRLGTRVGTNGIDIPKNANEICINVYLSDSEYPQYYKNIPIDLIGDTASTVLIDSTYYSSTDYTYITARISKTYVNLRLVWVNGKNVTATTNMVVSYR